ncbi:hypothetical protein Tco_0548987 [Tanacetum coccineum]
MATTSMSYVEQATREADTMVIKERLVFLVNQEIMKDALRVKDYKRMARQLKESVRRRSGYIGALKARSSGVDSVENLKFMKCMRLEDMEKGTCLLLMMKETEIKIDEKISFVMSLEDDVIIFCGEPGSKKSQNLRLAVRIRFVDIMTKGEKNITNGNHLNYGAVSIKEDTAYLCLHFTRNHEALYAESRRSNTLNAKYLASLGYSAAFKEAWDIISVDICKAVKEFFTNGTLLKEVNHTTIALILKVATPLRINDFRPISCCNVLFKCISKIISNRVKGSLADLVSLNQSAFVPGRRISDNILLTQELMHNYHLDRGPPRCAFKVDIQKSYDTVDWGFLKSILIGFGFHSRMIGWIIECVTTTLFSLCINGSLHGFFKGKRGLRQGDSMSPYLFTLVMEILNLMLNRRDRASNEFTYHRYCSNLNIINLCFADDLFLFAHGDVDSARVIMDSLDEFKNASGLTPSLPKSTTYFCNVLNYIKLGILNILPFEEGKKSLWVEWIHVYKLNGRLFLDISLRGNMSWGWRKILQIRELVRPYLWSKIGNGNMILAWFDTWNEIGPISNVVSYRDIHRAGFLLYSKVSDIINQGTWAWPSEWQVKYPILANIDVPTLSTATDGIVIRNLNNKEEDVSVSAIWECIRPRSNEVEWFRVVWFSLQIPRHTIHLWLVIQRKLKTQDMLRQWDVSNSNLHMLCPLCDSTPDSHEHLFFECNFSSRVWDKLKEFTGTPNIPSDLNAIVDFIYPFTKMSSFRSVACKLVFAASSYFIWQERNFRLFKKIKRNPYQIVEMIKSSIHLKLLTCTFKQTVNGAIVRVSYVIVDLGCMTRSSTKELFTPFKNPEREFRSSRKLFKTLSLDESSSPEFDLFSDLVEHSEEEVAEKMAETMEEYMCNTRIDYGSGVARPKIDVKDHFELKGQFLKELRDNTFSGSDHEDANEHIENVLKIVDLFHIPNITQDQIMLRAFPMSLTGAASRWLRNKPSGLIKTWQEPDETLYQAWERFKELLMKCPQHYLTDMQEVILFYNVLEVATRQILDSKGAIPTKTAADAKVAIQEMAEYFQKWHNGTSKTRSTETFDGLAAIQAQLNNLGREIKRVNKKVYVAQVGSLLRPTPLPEYPTRDFTMSTSALQTEKTVYTLLTSRRNIRDVVKKRVQRLRRVLDGAFGGVGDEEVVVGEGMVVTSSSLEMLSNSCLGGIMVSLIFLEGLEEEA